jgi:hypothetical protein
MEQSPLRLESPVELGYCPMKADGAMPTVAGEAGDGCILRCPDGSSAFSAVTAQEIGTAPPHGGEIGRNHQSGNQIGSQLFQRRPQSVPAVVDNNSGSM